VTGRAEARPDGTWLPATSAAWVIQPMTTMIRRSRVLIAASILTTVLMSFPTVISNAAIQRDTLRSATTRICPIDWRQSAWHVKKLIRCVASYHGISERKALYVAWRESRYRPSAYNPDGPAAGIYQHLVKYWRYRAETFGFAGWSVYNARANVFVTMRMVRRYGWDPWAT
jgi:hypothetical protein